jgi:hypothetical protein
MSVRFAIYQIISISWLRVSTHIYIIEKIRNFGDEPGSVIFGQSSDEIFQISF